MNISGVVRGLLVLLSFLGRDAAAQVYVPVAAGSNYICGYMPDGSSRILINNNGNYETVAFAAAAKVVAKQRAGLKLRVHQLQDLKREVKKHRGFNAEMVGELAVYLKNFNFITGANVKMPVTKQQKAALIDFLVEKAQLGIRLRDSALQGLRSCRDNKRPKPSTLGTDVVVIRGSTHEVAGVRLLLLVPETRNGIKFGDDAYCVKAASAGIGTAIRQTFTKNPCSRDAIFIGMDCSEVVPAGKLGHFWTGVSFSGVVPPSDDQVNEAINELSAKANDGFWGAVAPDCSIF